MNRGARALSLASLLLAGCSSDDTTVAAPVTPPTVALSSITSAGGRPGRKATAVAWKSVETPPKR